jgi:hypothetical protein
LNSALTLGRLNLPEEVRLGAFYQIIFGAFLW